MISARRPRATDPERPWPTDHASSPRRCAIHAGADSRRRDRRARAADLPDDELRLRQRRPRGEPVQPADLRQRLLAALEPDRRRARGARRRARRRPRRAGLGERHGGRGDGAADAAGAGRPRRRRRRALRRQRQHARGQPRQARHRDHLRRRARPPTRSPPRCGRRTRAVFAESLGNPSLHVLDIAAVAEVAHAHGVPLVVDNTVPSPFLCNPIALRRRHRRPLGDQVPRRPRHDARPA